ncbi:sensor histidine kinase [Flexithrix dorotheae]|uniref:sensor histidine kinase n=1 Tax=Flexithrix dorotheae TaxID=70993 RepID=UPI000367DBDC|nr:ATP-binding protein [Flexithrix dorotheae]
MNFKNFKLGIGIRVISLTVTLIIFVYLWFEQEKHLSAVLIAFLAIYIAFNLYHYVENTNRKLTRFLEYIKYSDFASGFAADNKLGKSFKELNASFNEVLEAFRQARSEKEEHWQYLNTVVQHVGIGLISFDLDGQIQLLNTAACRLLFINNILNISELGDMHPQLTEMIQKMEPGTNFLFRSNEQQLSIQATEIRLKGKSYKLISLKNIQNELQQKELESWQNLTSVLRHEIMNSITPISSLISTLIEIFEEELPENFEEVGTAEITKETVEDIKEAFTTIQRRSHALIRFVNAYKDFTHIPKPKFRMILVKDLLDGMVSLLQKEILKKEVELKYQLNNPSLRITIDPELIEMVLINLLKNATQAVEGKQNGVVELIGGLDENHHTTIIVADNGPGIIPEALNQIFIPFYTTKKEGSGIGLSLSRQIMQLHKGSLTVNSMPNERTEFKLTF